MSDCCQQLVRPPPGHAVVSLAALQRAMKCSADLAHNGLPDASMARCGSDPLGKLSVPRHVIRRFSETFQVKLTPSVQ